VVTSSETISEVPKKASVSTTTKPKEAESNVNDDLASKAKKLFAEDDDAEKATVAAPLVVKNDTAKPDAGVVEFGAPPDSLKGILEE
jgi:hypothetical protein